MKKTDLGRQEDKRIEFRRTIIRLICKILLKIKKPLSNDARGALCEFLNRGDLIEKKITKRIVK